ncbi:IS110 family transposase [Rhizobium sp. CG5]|uniref:IS110 family transposase n=1 Tax=Rhizobium sp. CG5 TaxID=2726076 RepID=UPI00254E7C7F|nr:IS110 family transposase [Rhizobium sp. CG5]
MSSIIRRRSGIISIIVISYFESWANIQSFKTAAILAISRQICRASGFVQSPRLRFQTKCSSSAKQCRQTADAGSGLGAITALGFAATIDDPTRFKRSSSAGAYLGLTPRIYASGEKMRSGRVSKRGDDFFDAAFMRQPMRC